MYNLLKYELFRLRKNKCLRIIVLLSFLIAFLQPLTYEKMLSAYIDEFEYTENQEKVNEQGEVLSEDGLTDEEEKEISIGLQIMTSSKWYEKDFKPSIYDYYVSIITSMIPALLFVIFAINLIAQEHSSGFIKSIGAYVRMGQIYLANMIMILIGMVLMNAAIFVSTVISSRIICGYVTFGAMGALIKYILYSGLLSFSFVAVPVALYYVVRSKTFPMLIGVLESVLGTIICGGIANLLIHEYLGAGEEFQLGEYFAVFHLKMSEFEFQKNAVENSIIFAIIGLVACSVVAMYALKKKDV